MEIPEQLREINRQEVAIREYKSDHTTAIVADFGPKVSDISVDIVDDTAIVVVGRDQFEFELPNDGSEITTNNGILTIEE